MFERTVNPRMEEFFLTTRMQLLTLTPDHRTTYPEVTDGNKQITWNFMYTSRNSFFSCPSLLSWYFTFLFLKMTENSYVKIFSLNKELGSEEKALWGEIRDTGHHSTFPRENLWLLMGSSWINPMWLYTRLSLPFCLPGVLTSEPEKRMLAHWGGTKNIQVT